MVQNYLKAVTSMEKKESNTEIIISEFVKSISIGSREIPADFNYKKERQDYLIEKYK